MPGLQQVGTAQFDPAWIRAVLFERAIEGWTDLALDPQGRLGISQTFSDHVATAYQAWKWICEQSGGDVNRPPDGGDLPEPHRLAIQARNWTELIAGLVVVPRAQGLLVADLIEHGDETIRRSFDRIRREFAGHAALAYVHLTRHPAIERDTAATSFAELLPATDRWLGDLGLDTVRNEWRRQITGLLSDAGYDAGGLDRPVS
jgi:hypothetical protein